MSKPDPATYPIPLLAAALRRWARYADEGHGQRAAVDLLIEYAAGALLPDLRARVQLSGDRDEARMAILDWKGVYADACDAERHRTARGVTLLACALATGSPVPDLGDTVTRLDGWNARRVLRALYAAMGGDERDTGHAWLAHAANAALAERVDVGQLTHMFADRTAGTDRRRSDGITGTITPAIAQRHLDRMLCTPSWAPLAHSVAGMRTYTWTWEAAERCRVTVMLMRTGVLVVLLDGQDGTWELAANAPTPHAEPTRPLSLFDLSTLRDHLRLVGIPVGEL